MPQGDGRQPRMESLMGETELAEMLVESRVGLSKDGWDRPRKPVGRKRKCAAHSPLINPQDEGVTRDEELPDTH